MFWGSVWKTRARKKRAQQLSMLGAPTIDKLTELAGQARGPIVELGPYVGGSSIALAAGSRYGVVSVEIGGSNPRDDHLSSTDILADLRRNLSEAGVAQTVQVVPGHFRAAATFAAVERALAGRPAGMLVVDLEPGGELALSLYSRLITDDAFVVVDDYRSDIVISKALATKTFIDAAVADGVLREIGLLEWGTWFGQLSGASARQAFMSRRAHTPCIHEIGFSHAAYVGHEGISDDRSDSTSPLVLLEDGEPLGPAHCLHDDIRQQGRGRYSHWNGYILFSASDNSDPRFNGRRYAIDVNGKRIDLNTPTPLR
jgi:predicted O-methyltransferase YrrM